MYEEKIDYGDIFTHEGVLYDYSVTAMSSSGTALTRAAHDSYCERGTVTGLSVSSDLVVSWDENDADYEHIHVNIQAPSGATSGFTLDSGNSVSIADYMKSEPTGTYKVWINYCVDVGYHKTTADSLIKSFDYVSTANFITSTDVTVSKPFAGKNPDFTARFVLNDGKLNVGDCIQSYEVRWKDTAGKTLKETDVLRKEKPILFRR
ncbi:MAG: hypothetical protein IJ555_10880 [Ruminococcus sp.]|nr:hypothetical protein [Ruminococcus sp.]